MYLAVCLVGWVVDLTTTQNEEGPGTILSCRELPPGYWGNLLNTTTCSQCPAGQTTSAPGSTAASACGESPESR